MKITIPGWNDPPREVITISNAISSILLCFSCLWSFLSTSARRKYACLMLFSCRNAFASSILGSQYSLQYESNVKFFIGSFFLLKSKLAGTCCTNHKNYLAQKRPCRQRPVNIADCRFRILHLNIIQCFVSNPKNMKLKNLILHGNLIELKVFF